MLSEVPKVPDLSTTSELGPPQISRLQPNRRCAHRGSDEYRYIAFPHLATPITVGRLACKPEVSWNRIERSVLPATLPAPLL